MKLVHARQMILVLAPAEGKGERDGFVLEQVVCEDQPLQASHSANLKRIRKNFNGLELNFFYNV